MKYPTAEAIIDAEEANDFECLKTWDRELPAPRTRVENGKRYMIERALIALGHKDPEDNLFETDLTKWRKVGDD